MAAWTLNISPSLEDLAIHFGEDNGRSLLPQMLAVAANAAPNLHNLSIRGKWAGTRGPTLDSLAMLTQIKTLHLPLWEFSGDGDVTDMQRISGLRPLEVTLVNCCLSNLWPCTICWRSKGILYFQLTWLINA